VRIGEKKRVYEFSEFGVALFSRWGGRDLLRRVRFWTRVDTREWKCKFSATMFDLVGNLEGVFKNIGAKMNDEKLHSLRFSKLLRRWMHHELE